jgi:hypothetical protein
VTIRYNANSGCSCAGSQLAAVQIGDGVSLIVIPSFRERLKSAAWFLIVLALIASCVSGLWVGKKLGRYGVILVAVLLGILIACLQWLFKVSLAMFRRTEITIDLTTGSLTIRDRVPFGKREMKVPISDIKRIAVCEVAHEPGALPNWEANVFVSSGEVLTLGVDSRALWS